MAELSQTLPSRRARLRAFVRLKLENRLLRVVLVAAVLGIVALAWSLARVPEARHRVMLGKGVAGVDATIPAAEIETPAPSPIATATRRVAEGVSRMLGTGEASYYGPGLVGNPTANGERFDPSKMTAAHRTLPMGSRVRVTDTRSGRSVVVRINDRGPYHGRRVIDLSEGAARKLGILDRGTARVRLSLLI
ncbi:septal ring lytic transglycosylase RlpA family protein [Stakelama tenebrarum]|uniref:Endolytic peptidoglycan transglycosylase RlpA n=1 Tax=Stakelama tenebrarum TaxID=2711215 RepID=A0A6G6Y177_9SPHN|nr:septal ring lytic transglycosylase RlpA family protein [Sphingosinithalassobacter tenebrarum]QIG78363.1 septal ring lytic transglycosylase RlpA family protein [Sphingosinithalassobacter tenebrarum]